MNKEKRVLLQAMREAGEAIEILQRSGFSVQRKANNDLLTQADLRANDILRQHLVGSFPHDAWLSEESADDLVRLNAKRAWIVDPIDGTKEYALGVPEYAISVALVEHGQPILASVFNPATQELFYAIKGEGAWLNDEKIICRATALPSLLLLASRSEYQRGEWATFAVDHEVKIVGSIAYKLALIAAGRADATFSLGPKSEWDIAAGVLLVQEAGGIVTDKAQQAYCFNQAQVKVNGIIASAKPANQTVMTMVEQRV